MKASYRMIEVFRFNAGDPIPFGFNIGAAAFVLE
jgi:hypothetical protein